MRYSYFPGCTMTSTGVEYGLSLNFLAEKIGLELDEIPDWNCCGATAGHALNPNLALALPARNLALAEKEGLGLDIAVPCAACYSRMKHAIHAARGSEEKRKSIEEIIEMPYKAENDAVSLLEVFSREEAMTNIKERVIKPLNGLKIACYYGCLLVRPKEITGFDDEENPMSMERILTLVGAKPIDWAFKTECCGGSHQVDAPKAARPLIYNIFKNAKANGAEAIATACPLCMMNLDMREKELNKTMEEEFDIPVYYFTELLAIAMGAKPRTIGLQKHFYPAIKLMNEVLNRPSVTTDEEGGKKL